MVFPPEKNCRSFSVIILILLVSLSLFFLSGCKGSKEDKDTLVITILDEKEGGVENTNTLKVLCWEEYLPVELIMDFGKEYGVDLIIDPIPEELDIFELIESDPGAYDLIITDDFMVSFLLELELISRFDKENIPNMAKVDPIFFDLHQDPNRNYSAPYMWGTLGIAVNRDYVKDENIGWGILFDPRFTGKIDLPDDIYLFFPPALKVMGESINERDPDVLSGMADLLVKQKEIVRGYFGIDEIMEHLIEGSSYIGYLFTWDGMTAAFENESIEYIVPDSGAPIIVDSWIIPAGAKNKNTAELFLNFLFEPENMAAMSDYIYDANTVFESMAYMSDELLETEEIHLPEHVIKNCELFGFFDEEFDKYLEELWNQIQVGY